MYAGFHLAGLKICRKIRFQTVVTMAANVAIVAPRRFAPLRPDVQNDTTLPKLDGIVFDVDGTLCKMQQ
jgi:hypothetical protein